MVMTHRALRKGGQQATTHLEVLKPPVPVHENLILGAHTAAALVMSSQSSSDLLAPKDITTENLHLSMATAAPAFTTFDIEDGESSSMVNPLAVKPAVNGRAGAEATPVAEAKPVKSKSLEPKLRSFMLEVRSIHHEGHEEVKVVKFSHEEPEQLQAWIDAINAALKKRKMRRSSIKGAIKASGQIALVILTQSTTTCETRTRSDRLLVVAVRRLNPQPAE